jgi:hypothetical protein
MPRNQDDVTVLDIRKRKCEVMKIQGFQKSGFTAALAAAIFTANVFGQTTTTETTPPPLMPSTPATTGPYLSPATSQVLQLTQAKVSDSTIIAYVQNSSTMYGLNADQIIYLKQQGVSDGVLNAMLNQSSRVAASIAAQTPPSNYGQPTPPDQSSTAVVQPTTAAPSSVYVVPDSQTANYNAWASQYYSYPIYYSYPYYYPYYYWPVTFSFYYGYHGGYYRPWYGWHGGYWNGGGWHGGAWGGGGVHTGGTWNGGGSGSFHSGGSMGMGGGGGFHH